MKLALVPILFLLYQPWRRLLQASQYFVDCCRGFVSFFGCYGDTVNQGHTPTVDRLAARECFLSVLMRFRQYARPAGPR